jgi:hypothetical protein
MSVSGMFHYIHEEREKSLVLMPGQMTLMDPY